MIGKPCGHYVFRRWIKIKWTGLVNSDFKLGRSVLLWYSKCSTLVKGLRKTTKKTSVNTSSNKAAPISLRIVLYSCLCESGFFSGGYVIVWRNRLPSTEHCLLRVEDGATPSGYIHVVNMPPAGGKHSSCFKIFQRLCTTSLVQRMSQ